MASTAGSRFAFDLGPHAAAARARDREAPFRLLLIADLGGDRQRAWADRKAFRVDIDNLDAQIARIAPRVSIDLDGQTLALSFGILDDFHPDALYDRLAPFAALRSLRAQAQDPAQRSLVAAALGLAAPATPATSASAPAEGDAASDIERLLGRAPTSSAGAGSGGAAGAGSSAAAAGAIDGWLRQLLAGHVEPAAGGPGEAGLLAALDQATTVLMRRVLAAPPLRALESAWRSVERLVRTLELDDGLELHLLDAAAFEWQQDLAAHRGDLSASAVHRLLLSDDGAAPTRYACVLLDHAFGADAQVLQALAAFGAIAARAGIALLAGAEPALAGAADAAALAEPRHWREADDESLAWWQALRTAPMARHVGLALPRVLLRLPYGARSDPITRFGFEELDAGAGDPGQGAFLWGGAAPALALLIGQAVQQGEVPTAVNQLDDLPSWTRSVDGQAEHQAVAECLLGEGSGQALLGRGLMPILAYRRQGAARLLRWQSIADPPQALAGL